MIQSRTVNRLVIWVVVVAIVITGLVAGLWKVFDNGDGSPSSADYCNQVAAQQDAIGNVATSGDSQSALIDALPVFESIASKAPADISASWTALTTAIAGLKSAIAATGHRPTDFSNGSFPQDVTKAQRQAIVAAADTLGSSTTSAALTSIVQEIRDVCQVDLNL